MGLFKDLAQYKKDKNNWIQIRLGNRDLMLIEDNDKLKIAILRTAKTWGFIFENINHHVLKEDKKTIAVSLLGEEYELKKVKTGHNKFEYYYNDKKVYSLIDYANCSKLLPFIVKKFKTLDEFEENSSFSDLTLHVIQEDINNEYQKQKLENAKIQKQIESEQKIKKQAVNLSKTLNKLHKETIGTKTNDDDYYM